MLSRPLPDAASTATPPAAAATPARPRDRETGRGWIVLSRNASVGRMREARRRLQRQPSCVVMTATTRPAANGSHPMTMWRPAGSMSTRVNRTCSSRAAGTLIGAASATAASEMSRASAATIPSHLSRGAPDRAEERELAVALLHRERECRSDDEDGDEGREQGEDRQARNRVLAPHGVRLGLRLAPSRSSQHPQIAALQLGVDAPGDVGYVCARRQKECDQVCSAACAGDASGDVVPEEDGRFARHPLPRAGGCDADHRKARPRRGGGDADPVADADRSPPGDVGGEDDLRGRAGRASAPEHGGGEPGAGPAVADSTGSVPPRQEARVPVGGLERKRSVGDRCSDARHGPQARCDAGRQPLPLGQQDAGVAVERLIGLHDGAGGGEPLDGDRRPQAGLEQDAAKPRA